MSKAPKLLIVGGGPVGIVSAVAAAQAGFAVELIEAANEIDTRPRASTTHPSTLEMIDRIGLFDRFVAEGLVAREFQFWDRETSTLVATFDHEILRNDTRFPFVVQTEQHKLARMGLDKLREYGVNVRFGVRAVACRQNTDRVLVDAETGEGPETLNADWVIAADGGRSAMRKSLGISFDGYTWPERFVVLTILDDMHAINDYAFLS